MDKINKSVPCEIYDRCCGYYRPVTQFNKGKQQEQEDRKRAHVTEITVEQYDSLNHD